MDFYALLDQSVELLRNRDRVSYRALTERCDLDDDRLDALRTELLYAHADRISEDGHGLVWMPGDSDSSDAERRQLTVLCCDRVDSTPLSSQLDPDEFREIMRAYYQTCGQVIDRFDGYLGQYLGDRIKGELLLRQEVPDRVRAQRCFEQALVVAGGAQARSWELRAATSLARMWAADGRRDEARAVLSPIYAWFTEGFDTPDVQDAKALLEQLS
jgi:class 3 adenylate cyclase